MHLLLVRHGQSSNNMIEAAYGAGAAFNAQRVVDPELSDMGQRQAELLGRCLGAQLGVIATKGHVRLMCSSMTRAMQTIRPLARKLAMQPAVCPDVFECKGFFCLTAGTVRGKGRNDLQAEFAEFNVQLVPPEGEAGENCSDSVARARKMAKKLRDLAAADGASEDIVVLVSHNDFIGLLARELLVPSGAVFTTDSNEPEQLFHESYWPMNNTGISHFVLEVRPPLGAYPVSVYLLYWNRSDHLPEELRSGVQFKNIGFTGAAEWARVGQGGSSLLPAFVEVETHFISRRAETQMEAEKQTGGFKQAREPSTTAVALCSAVVGAATSWLLLMLVSRRR